MIRRPARLVLLVAGVAAGALAAVVGASLALDHRVRVRRSRGTSPRRPEPPPAPAPAPPAPAAPAPAAPPARRRAPAPLRLSGLVLGWAAAGLVLTLLAALLVSFAAGYRSMTVMSGSMEPAIRTGDVVVNRPIAPLEARVGDVVTFREPGAGSRFITHRVRRITARGGRVTFITKGDANTGTERWTMPAGGELGRVQFHLPRLGYALFWTRGRHAILILITIPALLLGAMTLARIWRSPGEVSRGAPA